MQDVPKLVVERLQGMTASDPHPEADMLAAFAEKSLAQSERNLLLNHLARCAECRQIVALAQPEAEPEGVSGSEIRPSWWGLPALRWGFATAAVLAVISVSVVRYERRAGTGMVSSSSPSNQTVARQTDDSSAQSAPVSQAEKTQSPASTLAEQGTDAHSQSPTQPKRNLQLDAAGGNHAKRLETETSTIARNRAPDQLIQKQASSASPYQSYANSDVVKAKAAVPPEDSGSAAPALAPPDVPLQTARSVMQRASPQWAITARGGLQRSFDAGKTWQDVTLNAGPGQGQNQFIFRAVAAIGPEVWAGGVGAVLYHSADSGTNWQPVSPSASGVQAAGDITKIEFSSPEQCKIATSAGEIWTSTDSGQTWRKQ